VRAICRMEYVKLAVITEDSLKKLGYSYFKNHGHGMIEFEIREPCHMLARVEDLTRSRLSFLIRSPIVVESALELRRAVGTRPTSIDASVCASALAREIRSAMPEKPWKGTGVYRSRVEKNSWSKLENL